MRTTEFSWYVSFWVGMGAAMVTPLYILLYLILCEVYY